MTAEEIRTAAELYESGKNLKEIEAVIFYNTNTIRVNLKKSASILEQAAKSALSRKKPIKSLSYIEQDILLRE